MRTQSTIFNKLTGYGLKIINLGLNDSLSFEEKKITRLLNIFAITAFPYSLLFAFINISQKRYPLAAMNIAVATGDLLILLINSKRKFLTGRLVLSIMSIVLFTLSAIFYNNGGEYYLLLNIVATIILFNNKTFVVTASALNAIAFLIIKYAHLTNLLIDPVSPGRLLLNVSWALFLIIVTLLYYKSEHLKYQILIETSNLQLQQQQQLLLNQKKDLEEKTSQLEILNNTKEKIFSVVAHDIRSPIASLKSSLDLYRNNVISKEEFDDIAMALGMQVDTLYDNLTNLLQWSHSQLKGIVVKPAVRLLKPLALETISLLLQNAVQKKIKIEQHIPDNIYIHADPDHINLIIRNLVSNAIKFSYPDSKIEISALLREDFVDIAIKDEGVGMKETTAKNLFNPSVQTTNYGTGNEKGTGLGLLLCKEFTEKNNGIIKVYTVEGKGTTFTVSIPKGK